MCLHLLGRKVTFKCQQFVCVWHTEHELVFTACNCTTPMQWAHVQWGEWNSWMKNSCLKVNKNKSWHWQPEDRAFGNVLGLVQSENWSNLVTLLGLLWYYSPNLTCPNSQGTFSVSPKCCSYPVFAEVALLLECNPVFLAMMPTPLRKLKAFKYSAACITSNSSQLCSVAFRRTVQPASHAEIYRHLHWVHGML